jgi:hypothetical protein
MPKTLETLSKVVSTQIPMLRLLRKKVNILPENQPTYAPRATLHHMHQPRQDWQYWFSPIDLVKKILHANGLTRKMYGGMARYIDHPCKLFHSRAWGSSAMTSSGQFAHSTSGATIIPGDIVRLENMMNGVTKARVIFVGRDHRSAARNKGEVILTVQPVIGRDELQSHIPGLRVRIEELLLCKSSFEVRETDIRHPYDVEIDWSWDGKLTGRHYSGFFI